MKRNGSFSFELPTNMRVIWRKPKTMSLPRSWRKGEQRRSVGGMVEFRFLGGGKNGSRRGRRGKEAADQMKEMDLRLL